MRQKLLEILNYINSDEIDEPIFDVDNDHVVGEIDRILGKHKFLYYDSPNARVCLIFKKKKKYTIRMYWIKYYLDLPIQ